MHLALIGYPLGHSFSKRYFSEKFSREGIDARYDLIPVEDLTREKLVEILAADPELIGFNVTVPYKEKVAAWCDRLSPDARAIDAVNTVRIIRDSYGVLALEGHNTDWQSFRNTIVNISNCSSEPGSDKLEPGSNKLEPTLLAKSAGGKSLLLGTGGAAKAVRHALLSLGYDVTPVSRRSAPGVKTYAELTEADLRDHRLVVNTTPLGMWPNVDTCPPIPYEYIGGEHLCYDIVYNPEVTEFMRRSAAQGATIKNGLAMLYGQADLAWKIWIGEEVS